MAKDKTAKNHKYQTRSKGEVKEEEYKRNESSSDESEWETEDEEVDMNDVRKMIGDLFPSKYMSNRVIETMKSEKKSDDDKSKKGKEDKKTKITKQDKKNKKSENNSPIKITNKIKEKTKEKSKEKNKTKNNKDKKKRKKEESESESEYESESEEYETRMLSEGDSDSDSDSDDEVELKRFDQQMGKGNGLFNIILSMGEMEDETETESESEEEESDSEESEEEESENEEPEKSSKSKKENKDSITDEEAFSKIKSMIDNLSQKDKNNKEMKTIIKDFEKREKEYLKKEKKKTQKIRDKNTEKFKKILKEKNLMNDSKFFNDKLSVKQQETILTELEEIKKHTEIDKPYRLALIESKIPIAYKSIAYKKITTLKYMEQGGGEYYKIKNWVDTFMQIPFGIYKNIPLQLTDGVEKCHEFMEDAKNTLDSAVFGLNDAKLQIMQMIGQWIANPQAVGTAIAIKGPMGTGKTTLVKEGISKILGRDFAFIALGGATDSSFLEGHSYTYEGSSWGKIIDILIQSKCMNPVIYFDELDKVSDTPKGEEIIGILTHLTDTTQNSKFHDKYFSELDFDLSRCLFIFSYNDETKVNPILKDRMYRIQTKGYDLKEKTKIARDYLIPSIKKEVMFEEEDIKINDETIKHIIEKYTEQEQGVRNLKRCLEIIHTKLNLYRLMKPENNLFEKEMKMKIEFPIEVTNEIVDKMIKLNEDTGSWRNMYM
tara:strand:- start:7 stop:2154 length:2148 start_codon:yes stop_codon:yes gene_type:complete